MAGALETRLAVRLEELIQPSASDVRRGKRALMRVLDDGKAHRTEALLRAVAGALDAPEEMERLEILFMREVDPDVIGPDQPSIRFLRARVVGHGAVGELVAQGLIVPAVDPGNEEPRDVRWTADGAVRVGIRHPGGAFGIDVRPARPALAPAYMMASIAAASVRWYLDPDIFLEGLDGLGLDARATRALQEALASFQRGLYLATASLLGVVSEAAWYRAAEELGKPDGLERAVADGATARVQKLVADQLRKAKGVGSVLPDELQAHAALLRELRNYGVHPAGARSDHLERYLAEEHCGLLILQTHSYLVRLADAVAKARACS